jgi:hypothetical protein
MMPLRISRAPILAAATALLTTLTLLAAAPGTRAQAEEPAEGSSRYEHVLAIDAALDEVAEAAPQPLALPDPMLDLGQDGGLFDLAPDAGLAGLAAARTPREQRMPAVSYASHKDLQRFLLVWVEDRGSGSDIFGKFLFNNGLPQGGPERGGWQVVREQQRAGRQPEPPGERSDPALVWHTQREEYLMVYSEFFGEPLGWEIMSVRVSSAGFSRSKPKLLAGGPGDQQRPDVARQGDDYLVVWDDNTRDLDEVWGLRVRANGIPNGRAFPIFQGESWNATDPTTSGGVVAWVDDRGGDADIYAQRINAGNGLPRGADYRLAGTTDDDFAPRFGGSGLLWNVYDFATGADIAGAQVYSNNRTRGGTRGIVVPAADQSWPDSDQGIIVFSDNRTGEYDLYAVRLGGNFITRGKEFPLLLDYTP